MKKITLPLAIIIVIFGAFLLLNNRSANYRSDAPVLSSETTQVEEVSPILIKNNKSGTAPETYQDQESNGLIFKYSDGSGFGILMPEPVQNWIFDNATLNKGNISALFYPIGYNFNNAPVTIYAPRVVYNEHRQNLSEFIESERQIFTRQYPDIEIKRVGQINTSDGKVATLISYNTNSYPRYELVAYIDADGAVDMIVISAKNKTALEENTGTFNAVVKSYKYFPVINL